MPELGAGCRELEIVAEEYAEYFAKPHSDGRSHTRILSHLTSSCVHDTEFPIKIGHSRFWINGFGQQLLSVEYNLPSIQNINTKQFDFPNIQGGNGNMGLILQGRRHPNGIPEGQFGIQFIYDGQSSLDMAEISIFKGNVSMTIRSDSKPNRDFAQNIRNFLPGAIRYLCLSTASLLSILDQNNHNVGCVIRGISSNSHNISFEP